MKKVVKLTILLAMAICWMTMIFQLSSMTAQDSGRKGRELLSNFIEDALDFTNDLGYTDINPRPEQINQVTDLLHLPVRKFVHATVYLVLAMFVISIVANIMNHNHYFGALFITLAICVGFAILDEFHQTFVPGRAGAAIDVMVDMIGVAAGMIIVFLICIMRKELK